MTSTLPRFCMVAFVAVIGVACASTVSKSGGYAPAPMAPGDCPRGRPPRSAAEFEACVRQDSLTFDTTAAVGDEQPLMVVDSRGTPCPGDRTHKCRYGPRAKIEPEEHAHLWNAKQMQEGRIIARISLLPGETEPYRKFGLVSDAKTYWWVKHDGHAGRSVYVTITTIRESADTVEGTLEVYPYAGRSTISQAIARWIWNPRDEKTAGPCGSSASCK